MSAGEIIERRSESSIDQQGQVTRQHVESWYVESDTPKTTARIGEELGLLPTDPHLDDPLTLIKSVAIVQQQHRNPWRYKVTVTYANNVPQRGQQQQDPDNPFNDTVKVRWEDGEMEVTIDKDRDGNAILLPTKRPYNPGVKMLLPTGRLIINRNERLLDPDPDLNYRKHVNANTWAGKAAGTLLLRSINSQQDSRSGITFYPTEWVFEWNPLGWNEEVLLQDTHELQGGEPTEILDPVTKQPITEPVPIDVDGHRISAANLPAFAAFERINKYPEAAFEALGFPV